MSFAERVNLNMGGVRKQAGAVGGCKYLEPTMMPSETDVALIAICGLGR